MLRIQSKNLKKKNPRFFCRGNVLTRSVFFSILWPSLSLISPTWFLLRTTGYCSIRKSNQVFKIPKIATNIETLYDKWSFLLSLHPSGKRYHYFVFCFCVWGFFVSRDYKNKDCFIYQFLIKCSFFLYISTIQWIQILLVTKKKIFYEVFIETYEVVVYYGCL